MARRNLLLIWILAVLICGCSAGRPANLETVGERSDAVLATSFTLAFAPQVLAGAPLTSTDTLFLSDRVRVEDDANTPASIVNLGTGRTQLGPDSSVGSVWSKGSVDLAPRARVNGDVKSGGAIKLQPGVVVVGTQQSALNLVAPGEVTWQVDYPSVSDGARTVPNDASQSLAPSRYDALTVRARATLSLGAGSYYLDSLLLEPNASIRIDDSDGPVFIFVRQSLSLHGTVIGATGSQPNLLVAYFGTTSVNITGPFQGSIIARQAQLTFSSQKTHSGSFYAQKINVQPDTRIVSRPFLSTRFVFDDKTPLGQCSNRSFPIGTVRTVCLAQRKAGTATVQMYVNGVLATSTNDCVSATVVAPSVEVRAFEIDSSGNDVASDLAFLSPDDSTGKCPLYDRIIVGTRGDDLLRGTAASEYISGGPGNDTLVGNGGLDVLVGGSGHDLFDLTELRPVQIANATVVNDADDKIAVEFHPGNPGNLFQQATSTVTSSSIDLAKRRFQAADFGATQADYQATFGSAGAAIQLQAASTVNVAGTTVRTAAASASLSEVRIDKFGAVVGGVPQYNGDGTSTGVKRYVMALDQLVVPALDSSMKCGGGLKRCHFASISLINAAGEVEQNVLLPRAEHYIRSVKHLDRTLTGSNLFLVAGYSLTVASDAPCKPIARSGSCRSNQAFIARFDAGLGKFDFFQYFDGRIRNQFATTFEETFGPAAPHTSFYDVECEAHTIVAVGTTDANGDAEADDGTFGNKDGIKGYMAVSEFTGNFCSGAAADADLPLDDARAFRNSGVGDTSRFKHLTLEQDTFNGLVAVDVVAGGHAGTSHFAPWMVSAQFRKSNGELRKLSERVLTHSSFFNEVGGIARTGTLHNFVAGTADEFNAPPRTGIAAFLTQVRTVDLVSNGLLGSYDPGPFFQPNSAWRLFGGIAQSKGTGVEIDNGTVHVSGVIFRPWDPSLLTTVPTTDEGGPFGLMISMTLDGQLKKITSIDNSNSTTATQTDFEGVMEGLSGGPTAWGSVCVPVQGDASADCDEHPYMIGLDEDLRRPNCSCHDNTTNCGEDGPDCGVVCGNACPPPVKLPPPDPDPVPEATCKIDPNGTETTPYFDKLEAQRIVGLNGCQSCHGPNLVGTNFAPCLNGLKATEGQTSGCIHDALGGVRKMKGMPQILNFDGKTCGEEILINYLLGLTDKCKVDPAGDSHVACSRQ